MTLKGMGRSPQAWQLWAEGSIAAYTIRAFTPAMPASPDAPTLVMIHGMEEGWDIWMDMALSLAHDYRLFCLDIPWQGRDGYHWGQVLTVRDWMDRALELVPSAPEVIVAHSFGATATLEWMTHHPLTRLRGVVLVAPFYRAERTDFDWDLFNDCLRGFRAIMEQGLKVRQVKKIDPAVLMAMADKVMERIGPSGFLEFFSLFARTPALRLDRVTVPTLVVTGTLDLPLTACGNPELVQRLPQGSLELVPECGHFCMLEQPAAFRVLLQQYLLQWVPAPDEAQPGLRNSRTA